MNIEQLKVFHLAAIKKNFSETAKILHLSQPSVSLQIKHLEDELNTSLFDRRTKKMALTDSGKILFKYADQIIQLMNQAENELSSLAESIHGELRLGASLTIGEYLLPYHLGHFIKKHPNVRLQMKIDNSHQIVEKLLNGEIDLGLIEVSIPHEKLENLPFLEDELVLISTKNHPLLPLDMETLDPMNLYDLPIIMREKGSGTRQVLEANLLKNNINPDKLNVIIEFENTESIKSAVESGLGVAILSKTVVKKETELGLFQQTKISGIPLKRSFYILNKQQVLSPAAAAFKKSFLSSVFLKK